MTDDKIEIKAGEKILPPSPLPKVELFMPLDFWSEILMTLDKETQEVCRIYGFGKVSVTLTINNSGISAVNFGRDVKIQGQNLTDKAKKSSPK